MAFLKKLESHADDAQKCRRRHDLVQHLSDAKTVEARKALKGMRDVWYGTDKPGSAGEYWNPKAKQLVRASSGKCDRINRGHRAKFNQAIGL